jgi:hypothetical protein
MDIPLYRALVALLPTLLLLAGSTIVFFRQKIGYALMQVFGAGCLVLVVVTHICEALHLFPGMNWGLEHSAGHYLALGCAVLGFTLFPLGYLLHAISAGQARTSSEAG